MKYYLGIDGGGTKTEFLLADEFGYIVNRILRGPSNPIFIDICTAFQNITEGVSEVLQPLDNKNDLCSIAVCIPGIKRHFHKIDIFNDITINKEKLYVGADELNAFYGALGKEYGIVILSGTGSFGMGIDQSGNCFTAGGWGPILGDEGSGYYIGLSCIKAVIKEYENVGPATILTNLVKEAYHINEISELRTAVYQSEKYREQISKLCMMVEVAAQKGDKVAISILKNAAEQLVDIVDTIAKNLQLMTMENSKYDIVLTGGVSKIGKLIWEPFIQGVQRKYPYFNAKEAQFNPGIGALMIAMKKDNIQLSTDILKNFEHSYDKY